MNRKELSDLIFVKLNSQKDRLKKDFADNSKIQTCYIDDLLPVEIVKEIYKAFPDKSEMAQRKSLRENKRVAAQLNKYNPLLEEITFAFQQKEIVDIVTEITGLREMHPDENLYAGGISLMAKDNFLRPHLDNSHNMELNMYRVLNLLFYVTPDWKPEYGGNLELWDSGPKNPPRQVFSKFNRLVLMITNKNSLHSVNKVIHDGSRCCISNYYFSPIAAEKENYFHVTSFRGRNDEYIKDIILRMDAKIRNGIRTIFKKGIFKVWHKYNKGSK